MRYISGLHEGETIRNIYLCKGKRSAETRNGNHMTTCFCRIRQERLTEKYGTRIRRGLADYDEKDFIEVYGEVINYNGICRLI